MEVFEQIKLLKLKKENKKLKEALKNSINCRKFGGCFSCPCFHEQAPTDEMCDNDILIKELELN